MPKPIIEISTSPELPPKPVITPIIEEMEDPPLQLHDLEKPKLEQTATPTTSTYSSDNAEAVTDSILADLLLELIHDD